MGGPNLTRELVPSERPGSDRLMLVLHGLGDSMEGYRWLPEAMGRADLNYLLVNAPDAYYGGYSWYDFDGDQDRGIRRSRSLLFELLDATREEGFPTGKTTVLGFSQGCLMTWELGLRYPHRFAGLVGISGYAHEPLPNDGERSAVACDQRYLITHGTQDPLIPFSGVKRQVAGLRDSGLDIDWREFDKPHTIAGEQEMAVIRGFVREGYEA